MLSTIINDDVIPFPNAYLSRAVTSELLGWAFSVTGRAWRAKARLWSRRRRHVLMGGVVALPSP
jgi:hypothetical protein